MNPGKSPKKSRYCTAKNRFFNPKSYNFEDMKDLYLLDGTETDELTEQVKDVIVTKLTQEEQLVILCLADFGSISAATKAAHMAPDTFKNLLAKTREKIIYYLSHDD